MGAFGKFPEGAAGTMRFVGSFDPTASLRNEVIAGDSAIFDWRGYEGRTRGR